MSTPDEVDLPRLTKQVGRALVSAAVDGWTSIRAEYRAAGRHIEVDVLVAGPDGRPLAIRPPVEVVEGLGRIREGMYQPGRGTWLRAVYEIEPPGAFTCDFEPDVEPVWRRVPPTIGFLDELRAHPRSDAHIPDWLRARAGLPPAPPPEAPQAPQQTPSGPVPAQNPAGATVPPASPTPPPAAPHFPAPPGSPGHPITPGPTGAGHPAAPAPHFPGPPRQGPNSTGPIPGPPQGSRPPYPGHHQPPPGPRHAAPQHPAPPWQHNPGPSPR